MQHHKVFLVLLFALSFGTTYGQLGFCSGSSGDPIFTEDFGTGTTQGPALPFGTTTYTFTSGTPNDGSYTISSNSRFFEFHDIPDHTPGDTNGKMFIINADDSVNGGEFFRTTVTGLCENTTYEFSSWLINILSSNSVCPGGGIPINVKFQILDSSNTIVLAEGDTGDIPGTLSPVWDQYALVFTTKPGENSVVLKMLNNGIGGCGNDLAIDDIAFRTCGDFVSLTDTANNTFLVQCEAEGALSATLNVKPDFSIFTSHAYQWQQSADGSIWNDIIGETSTTYTTPLITEDTFYRVKVAEDPINLNNDSCNIVSDIFDINIVPQPNPPVSNGDITVCRNAIEPITVTVPNGLSTNWYDAPIDGNLILEGSRSFRTETAGTYYAEAISSLGGCVSGMRTPVRLTLNEPPTVTDEILTFCENESIEFSASVDNASYRWNNGETTREIRVNEPGTYTVEITASNNCIVTKTIELNEIKQPIIKEIISDHRDVVILMANEGDFEYAIDGFKYTDSPRFENLRGGRYTAFVRGKTGCGAVQQEFIHLVIPRFFTPNGDGSNDSFQVEGAGLFATFEIQIFDRMARLLKQSNNADFLWDGTVDNNPVLADDYWYSIQIDEAIFKGHFTLKR
ncbi:T9SS type B sorting domain-containing protein [Maribacter sp. 2210JD10-5]|uniref:T9SS type B sorting domain-containing protein n=1 Tax=Maribacter sp. 2210JD10-5 TaxID=3386272 RepID=UPI0039BCDE30